VGIAKNAFRGVTALSIGAATWLMGSGVAGADEAYSQSATKDHTFTNGAGQQVTCTIDMTSSLFRPTGQPEFFGSAFTDVFGFDESCDLTFVAVDATYKDISGRDRRVTADSIDGDVFLTVDNVRSNYKVAHSVFFFDCTANCDFSFTTSPK
jgi:hypothetical protein